ncbi:TMEM175 family protein [Lactobacillus terrae]|uniref:TMEM175 family protein n=1 Tax=Lactobacillus terrae TaxID=2269374 RepID=UPI000C1B62AF|nr:TMEM175 family protein [Lactobacillus terrae]
MNKSRVEAFVDAIIAIVLTVLILEIKVPEEPSLKLLFGEWQMAFSYLMTFILVMFSWYVQHEMFIAIKWINVGGFIGVCTWLFCLSFLPIATSFVGHFPEYWGAELVYVVTCLIWLFSARFMSYMLRRDNKDVKELDDFSERQAGKFMLISNLVWTLFAIVGLFFIPYVGLLTPLMTVLIQVLSNIIVKRRRATK